VSAAVPKMLFMAGPRLGIPRPHLRRPHHERFLPHAPSRWMAPRRPPPVPISCRVPSRSTLACSGRNAAGASMARSACISGLARLRPRPDGHRRLLPHPGQDARHPWCTSTTNVRAHR
jgi:hypothetical protein